MQSLNSASLLGFSEWTFIRIKWIELFGDDDHNLISIKGCITPFRDSCLSYDDQERSKTINGRHYRIYTSFPWYISIC
jgi:hypothetical protein